MNIKQFTSWLGSKVAVERVVTFLTPLVFAPAATFVAAYVASHFPGLPHPSASELEGLEVAAFLGACGIAYKWLHGRQLAMSLRTQALLQGAPEAAPVDPGHPIVVAGPPGPPGPAGTPGAAGAVPADLEKLVDEALSRRLSVLTQAQAS